MPKSQFSEIDDLEKLKKMFSARGANCIFIKKLSPNDNSKNQVYLGGDFEALNILPYKDVYVDGGRDGSKRDRFKADIDLGWMVADGTVYPAPNAQLILYPKYPEVRMSGFLLKCENPPSETMVSRDEDRLLFLGITEDGKIIGHATSPDNPVRKQLEEYQNLEPAGVFLKLPVTKAKTVDTREQLIKSLRDIHRRGWIDSVRLGGNGVARPYSAANGGGYTLEAQLGISPNGHSDPDYLGWEIKQHGVTSFEKPHSGSPITLMTPEPTGGLYRSKGVEYFIRTFGYADTSGREDRMNFGGVYRFGVPATITGLVLQMPGYDIKSGKITDPSGGLTLVSPDGREAATWHYADMMKHWNRKHAQAAYIPSMSRSTSETRQYCYGNLVELGEGTDFLRFLKAVAQGTVFYDPGIKLEKASTPKPVTKRRSQFRIKGVNLKALYERMAIVDVLE